MRRLFINRAWSRIASITLAILCASLQVVSSASAQGITPQQQKIFNNDVQWFNYSDDQPCNNPVAAAATFDQIALVGSDNVEKAYNYFVARGLTPTQSAGIVGNMMAESGVDPKAVQGGGPGRGIVQWSVGDRWDTASPVNGQIANVKAWAASRGGDMLTLEVQLDFTWQELNNIPHWNKALVALKATTSVDDAAYQILNKYEIAQGYNDPNSATALKRKKFAEQVLAQYGGAGGGGPQTATTTTATGSCGSAGGGGVIAGNIAQTAIGLAWPEPFKDANPREAGRTNALTPSPAYDQALTQFNPTARNGNNGADCGAFVATVMHASGVDPNYPPIGTSVQYNYVTTHPEKYQIVNNVPQSQLQPGDILIVTAGQRGQSFGHTWIYVGPQASGYYSASASLNDRAPNMGRETVDGFTVAKVLK